MYKKVPGRLLLFERLRRSHHRTMMPNAGQYNAWSLWPQCNHTITTSIVRSRRLDDVKLVVIGRQSIRHSLPAWKPVHTKLTDSSDEPYEANTVSVAVSGQGSIPRLIDVLITTRLFLPSGTNRVIYRDSFGGGEISVEFIAEHDLLYLPAPATKVADLGNTAYSIPCSSLVDVLIDYFWRSSDWSTTTE
ncbi:hypothetical protein BO85DRAFT_497621 [Aspergillus piperis CBS 112811]|uniref:Uncharacterized protein n=1 Tax=Aspergillus piperis CBS 112811 TaxID=1448313 RepID=A0A8G1QYP0_9EURO|nr:hypothetical protein BO85DRAFT_497621 [Aspergillus piperis CBS 112811]RAH56139.1 hypothetical protein BO85DRAFT_497621 [Aspergillus piperis CBS 112811]